MYSRQEIIDLLTRAPLAEVINEADRVRREFCGDEVHLRAIIEFSNVCIRTCDYCGLRGPNRDLNRYRMSVDEVVETARNARQHGLRTIVLQSGEDPRTTTEEVCEMVRQIKAFGDTAVTLSLGLRSIDDYRAFREAGADRYLMKEETADERLYARLHNGLSLTPRITTLSTLKSLGYQVGGGVIVGLPGQTAGAIADSLIFARDIALDMYAVGPFIPHPDTPLHDSGPPSIDESIRVLATARIVLEDAHLPATSALQALHPSGWLIGLLAGANVIMSLATPAKYRQDYAIYPNPGRVTEDTVRLDTIRAAIEAAGRTRGAGVGDSLKRTPRTDAISGDAVTETGAVSYERYVDAVNADR